MGLPWANYALAILTQGAGIVGFAFNFACMASAHWGEFASARLNRAGYLSPWRICQPTKSGGLNNCVSSESISNKLFTAGVLGNTGLFFQMFYVGAGMVEIMLLTQRFEWSGMYRGCMLAKVIFSGCATITTMLSAYLFTSGLEALVTYKLEHSPPFYVWWSVGLISMCAFGVSCVQAWFIIVKRFIKRAATQEVEEISMEAMTTGNERSDTDATNVPATVTVERDTTEPQPSTSRSGVWRASRRGTGPYRSTLASSRLTRLQPFPTKRHQASRLVVRFQAIPEETESNGTDSSD